MIYQFSFVYFMRDVLLRLHSNHSFRFYFATGQVLINLKPIYSHHARLFSIGNINICSAIASYLKIKYP